MNWSSSLGWLASLAARSDTRAAVSDPADMGTAFGLDASMMPTADSAFDAIGRADDQTLEPWERRIVRRSSL